MATRNDANSSVSSPFAIAGVNQASFQEDRAALSNDGRTLYFVSARTAGSLGEKDIWFATRSDGVSAISDVQNLSSVNAIGRDIDVSLSVDATDMFFVSRRDTGGRAQIYRSVRGSH